MTIANRCRFLGLVVAIGLTTGITSGCANVNQRDAAGNPLIMRASPDQLAAGAQQAPARMTIEDLVQQSRQGASTEQIMARYRASGTRMQLSERQAADLGARGVAPETIAAVIAAEREALRTDRVTAQVDQERAARERADRALQNRPVYPPGYSYGPRVAPYFGYGWGPRGRGWSSGVGIGF